MNINRKWKPLNKFKCITTWLKSEFNYMDQVWVTDLPVMQIWDKKFIAVQCKTTIQSSLFQVYPNPAHTYTWSFKWVSQNEKPSEALLLIKKNFILTLMTSKSQLRVPLTRQLPSQCQYQAIPLPTKLQTKQPSRDNRKFVSILTASLPWHDQRQTVAMLGLALGFIGACTQS